MPNPATDAPSFDCADIAKFYQSIFAKLSTQERSFFVNWSKSLEVVSHTVF